MIRYSDYLCHKRQTKYIRREKLPNGKWKYYYYDPKTDKSTAIKGNVNVYVSESDKKRLEQAEKRAKNGKAYVDQIFEGRKRVN